VTSEEKIGNIGTPQGTVSIKNCSREQRLLVEKETYVTRSLKKIAEGEI
jgi:hypothetical protein